MGKSEMLQHFNTLSEEDKALFLEKYTFCKFADEYDFENYFKIEELRESDLLCLMSFLFDQECFFMMMDIMKKHKMRFVFNDESLIEEADFTENFISRMIRMERLEGN